jgi:hypothetical protein
MSNRVEEFSIGSAEHDDFIAFVPILLLILLSQLNILSKILIFLSAGDKAVIHNALSA